MDSIVEAISLTIDEEDRDPDSGGTFSINATAGISGSAEAGLVVRLTVNDGTESAVFLATADSTGSWTLELSDVNTLTIEHDEQLTVTATVMDAVGNVDTQDIGTWTVDAVASPINLTIDDEDFDLDNVSINATAGISGSTEAASIVRITVADPTDGDFTIFTTKADAAGSWTLELQPMSW